MLFDPCEWTQLKSQLREWAKTDCPLLQINEMTDRLFSERMSLSHKPRKMPRICIPSTKVYKFFDPEQIPRNEVNHFLAQGIPLDIATKINKINNHNKDMCMIGILPNQLKTLLNSQNQTTANIAFEDISKEIFWQSYSIWQTRKRHISEFWRNIVPENWKPHQKEIKNLKRIQEIKIAEQCSNPFHFLIKNKDLSKQKRTICQCSHVKNLNRVYNFKDIRSFFTLNKQNKQCQNICVISAMSLKNCKRKTSLYTTREDRIRGAHDRIKRSRLDLLP